MGWRVGRGMSKLKAMQIKTLPDGKHLDGGGLQLVRKGGAGKWIWRYTHLGKRREMGLGTQADVTLAEARKIRDHWRAVLTSGRDPVEQRRAEEAEAKARLAAADPTFAEATAQVFEAIKEGLRGDGVNGRWMSPLNLYVIPAIGNLRISEITREDVRSALDPIWRTKHETAKKARDRTRIVLEHMAAAGYEANPLAVSQAALILGQVRTARTKIAATPWREIPDLFARLSSDRMADLCLKWVMLTAVRSNAARGARRSEVEGGIWTVPADRIKGREGRAKDFRVPLSTGALEVLASLEDLPGDALFSARRGKCLTDQALTKRLDELKEPGRVHGFRTSFRTWAQETRSCDRDVAEMALGHKVMGEVEEAYARSDLLDLRAAAMQRWSDFVTGEVSAKVITLGRP